jgi:hypothetical protein
MRLILKPVLNICLKIIIYSGLKARRLAKTIGFNKLLSAKLLQLPAKAKKNI